MRRVVPILLTASRVLAILAMLAGLAVGLLAATAGAGLICFDTCPTPEQYFPRLVPGALFLLTPAPFSWPCR